MTPEEPPNPFAASQSLEMTAPTSGRFVAIVVVWTFSLLLVGIAFGVALSQNFGGHLVAMGLHPVLVDSILIGGAMGLGAGVGRMIGRRKAARLRCRWEAMIEERRALAEGIARRTT